MLALYSISCGEGDSTFKVLALGPHKNLCGISVPATPEGTPGLIIWFHGGMRSHIKDKGRHAHRALAPFIDTSKYYLASPSAFTGQDWLSAQGMENTGALADYMLQTYSINKNNIILAGVSDGSLGVILYSLKANHPIRKRLLFSSYPQLAIDEKALRERKILYQGSWHFFQGGKDRLFPGEKVLPFLKLWKETVPNTVIHWYPEGLHDFSYYADSAGAEISAVLGDVKR
jgi:hypothetical protein